MSYVPVLILDEALKHAKEKYKIDDLNRNLLVHLYGQVRARRKQLAALTRKRPNLKISASFAAAREWVLDQRFPQCGPDDQLLRRAYSSAIGKIGHSFRKEKQPRFRLERSERDRIMDRTTLDKDRRQYRLFL